MFKRENRLVPGIRFSSSSSYSVPELILKAKKNDLVLNRFGIVVSKKIDKKAVGRNKIKRMLRDILMILNKNMIPGHDILVITRVGILGTTKSENHLIIKSLLIKAGIIKK